jgi:hypothetical protein
MNDNRSTAHRQCNFRLKTQRSVSHRLASARGSFRSGSVVWSGGAHIPSECVIWWTSLGWRTPSQGIAKRTISIDGLSEIPRGEMQRHFNKSFSRWRVNNVMSICDHSSTVTVQFYLFRKRRLHMYDSFVLNNGLVNTQRNAGFSKTHCDIFWVRDRYQRASYINDMIILNGDGF